MATADCRASHAVWTKRTPRLVAMMAAGLAAVSCGNRPEPTLETQLVTTDVVVVTEDGQPARGLSVGDFEVVEDGERCSVVFAKESNSSWTAAQGAHSAPRLIVAVLDDAGMNVGELRASRLIVAGLFERVVVPGERLGLLSTGPSSLAVDAIETGSTALRAFEDAVSRYDGETNEAAVVPVGGGPALLYQTLGPIAERLSRLNADKKAILVLSGASMEWNHHAQRLRGEQPRTASERESAFGRLGLSLNSVGASVFGVIITSGENRTVAGLANAVDHPLCKLADMTCGACAIGSAEEVAPLWRRMSQETFFYYTIGYKRPRQIPIADGDVVRRLVTAKDRTNRVRCREWTRR